MSAGANVYKNIEAIKNYCENIDQNELDHLFDLEYSRKMFGLNFPFFIDVNDIDESNKKKKSKRFLKKIYIIRGKRIRVTSQWTYGNVPCFKKYMETKNIQPIVPMPENIRKQTNEKNRNPTISKANNRNAIGNAQNLLIRNILSSISGETFNENDWLETKKYFNDKCVYCGSTDELEKDHAIPINKEKLGEHKIGNIIPSCKKCNSEKANKDYREFLGGNIEAIKKIETYMESKNYVPLGNNEKLKRILNMAYEEVAIIADRYINIINELFIKN
jgi:5-methylcytosine-specific restriction endonuclease McrA